MKSGTLSIATIACVGVGLLILLALLLVTPSQATELDIDGQVRVRLEGYDRTFQGLTSEAHVFQRVRLGLKAVVAEDTEAFLQLQDARIWGFEAATIANERNIDLFQAWGQWKAAWADNRIRIRGGRQTLSYGNERILGAVAWSNIGRSFDALHTRLQRGGWTGDFVLSRLRDETFNTVADGNDDLYFTYHQFAFSERDMRLEGYLLYRNDRSGRYETTPGVHFDGTTKHLRWDAEFTSMSGRRNHHDLRSFLASAQAHVLVLPDARLFLGAGLDYLSGDDPDTDEDEFFDVARIFDTGHKFYGFMDVAPLVAGRAGLIDPHVVVTLGGAGRFSGVAAGHFFMVEQPGQVPGEESHALGTEIDAEVHMRVATRSRISVGGAVFVPGAFLENQGRDRTASWGYAQALVDF